MKERKGLSKLFTAYPKTILVIGLVLFIVGVIGINKANSSHSDPNQLINLCAVLGFGLMIDGFLHLKKPKKDDQSK